MWRGCCPIFFIYLFIYFFVTCETEVLACSLARTCVSSDFIYLFIYWLIDWLIEPISCKFAWPTLSLDGGAWDELSCLPYYQSIWMYLNIDIWCAWWTCKISRYWNTVVVLNQFFFLPSHPYYLKVKIIWHECGLRPWQEHNCTVTVSLDVSELHL